MSALLTRLHQLVARGELSPAAANEARAVYFGQLAKGRSEADATLATAAALRRKAEKMRESVQAMIHDPSLIPDVAAALTEQWREAQAGKKPN